MSVEIGLARRSTDVPELTLKFRGVIKLSLPEIVPDASTDFALELVNIKDRQLEGASWELLDFEQGRICVLADEVEMCL
jgi:hypothetical protein